MRNLYTPYSLHTRSRRHTRNGGKPEPERNIPAAFFSLVVGGIYAVAMAEPKWLKINGGKCNNMAIGLYKLFGVGRHTSPTSLEGTVLRTVFHFRSNELIFKVIALSYSILLRSCRHETGSIQICR